LRQAFRLARFPQHSSERYCNFLPSHGERS
jgi:hypothetical protein